MANQRSAEERLAVLESEVAGGFQRSDKSFADLNLRLDRIDETLGERFSSQNERITALELEHAQQRAVLRALLFLAGIPYAVLSAAGALVALVVAFKEFV